jgi:hypothetical protein
LFSDENFTDNLFSWFDYIEFFLLLQENVFNPASTEPKRRKPLGPGLG